MRYKFFENVSSDYANNDIKGFPKESLHDLFTFDDDLFITIDTKYQYRPDLIANNVYGNPKLYYILVYANNINDSPEGFYSGRQIRVPRFENIVSLI